MLDGLLHRNNFRTKCKSAITRTKHRLEVIKKKRIAVQKFLKKDVAELLKNNLDRNAYGRAEGLYNELNLTSCYDYVGHCCNCISEHLKEMQKERECPEGCRAAVASLVYAAARFSDLPDLRDLRNLFNGKYDKSLEAFVSDEFTEKFKANPPTTEMKIQLMHEIAQEFSVEWDSRSFQQQLHAQDKDNPIKLGSKNGLGDKMLKTRSTISQVKSKQENNNKLIDEEQRHKLRTRRHSSYSNFSDDFSEVLQEENDLKNEKFQTRNKEVALKIKEEGNNNDNRNVDDDLFSKAKPRPKSVRTKSIYTSASTTTSSSENEMDVLEMRVPQGRKQGEEDEVVSVMSRTHYSAKKPLKAPSSARIQGEEGNFNPSSALLPPPPGRRRYLFTESPMESPRRESETLAGGSPARSKFLPPDFQQPSSPTEPKILPIRPTKSDSFLNEGKVHKIPSFDELTERVAALKNM